MKKRNNTVALIFAALAILCFQILYYQLTVILLQQFAARCQGWSNDCYLMIHHTIQFLLVFIPTLILHKKTNLDFGYHINGLKKGIIWVLVGLAYELVMSIVSGIIFGFGINTYEADTYIFQLFFSGFGEEILYRAIPLVLLPFAYGSEPTLRIGSKIKLPIDVMIAALFFSIAHISFQFGQPGISYSELQLVSAFGAGIIFGMIFKKSHSVWLCMIAHGVYNILAITF
ncbi:MAG: CPBP family intramembrane metalloprotease [Clostridia bacterium]|nr:CPBP family intramembrane metalloprotease [Clostridia bacterium]